MAKRTVYGALAILALLTLFCLDSAIAQWAAGTYGTETPANSLAPVGEPLARLLRHGSVVPLGLAIMVLLGSVEFVRLLRAKGMQPHAPFACLMSVAVFLSPWLSAAGWLGSDVAAIEGLYWPLILIAATVLGAGFLHVLRGVTVGSLGDLGGTCLIVLYVGFLSSFALQLRSASDSPAEQGLWLLLITLLVTKATDIGAYFAGSLLGKHRLAPAISPQKSVEGAIGGVAGSALTSVLIVLSVRFSAGFGADGDPSNPSLAAVLEGITGSFASSPRDGAPALLRALIFGVALSAAAQTGDLFESCLKRDAGIKDSGSILPQFGGILDLIDSPVFAVPVAWFLLSRVWHLI